ncbi:unnamed protein product [Lupinus luteus]|uniref:Uncharacterized protein n=1 Tax=Lupinus luteus TaxID=3873 RepID=A0AAV1YP52_LUPLU
MKACNAASTPAEANCKLIRDDKEEGVDETLYKQVVGSLRFLCNSRPGIAFAVGVVSRFMNEPKKSHMLAAKRILRYIQGTLSYGILFPTGSLHAGLQLLGFSDSDYGGDPIERKSTSGYLFLLNNAPISWCSKKQEVIALSSCEAEYIAGCYAACQAMWLEELLREISIDVKRPVQLRIDNMSAINLSRNPVSHGRSKHIEVRFHFLRDLVNKERVEVLHCNTEEQLADGLTKALKPEKVAELRKKIGLVSTLDLCYQN